VAARQSQVAVRQNEIAVRQNKDMRKISAWAAIAIVPTAIAGIRPGRFPFARAGLGRGDGAVTAR
jgi:hypothetical protein